MSKNRLKIETTMEIGTKITAVFCKNCKSLLISRAGHDFHYCPCEKVAIDGGFEYVRVLFETRDIFEFITIRIKADKRELYEDWNHHKNKYGTISMLK